MQTSWMTPSSSIITCREPINNQSTFSERIYFTFLHTAYQMILRRSWVAMEFADLFLNQGSMSYKRHCSANHPNVSKLHFWNSGPEACIRLEQSMCQWQLMLRPTRRIGKTRTDERHLPLYCVSVHARGWAQTKWLTVYEHTVNTCDSEEGMRSLLTESLESAKKKNLKCTLTFKSNMVFLSLFFCKAVSVC